MRFNNGKGLKSINLLSNMIARSDDFNFLADSGYDTYTETLALIAKQKQLYNDNTFENIDYIVSGLELEVITGQLILKAGAAVSFKGYYHGTLSFGYVASPGDVFSVVVPESTVLTIDNNIGGAYDRFDVIEIRPIKQTYDTKSRQFRDPITGAVTSALVNIKNEFGYELQIKKGNAAVQNFAHPTTVGWIKLAEYKMPVGASTVSNINITSVKDSHLWLTAKDSVKYLENKNPINLNNNLVGAWSGNVPEYPDNLAGMIQLEVNITSRPIGWDMLGGGATTEAFSGGNWIIGGTSGLGGFYRTNVSGTFKVKARVITGTALIGVEGVDIRTTDNSKWVVYNFVASSNTIILYASQNSQIEIDWIYIGDGTYSSQAIDLSGNGNHAQIFGATPVEGGFSFDGVNDYCSTNLYTGTEFTVSTWVKRDLLGTSQRFIGSINFTTLTGLGMAFRGSDNALRFAVGASSFTGPTIIDSSWHMVTACATGNVLYMYLDGVSIGTLSATIVASDVPIMIGKRPTSPDQEFFSGTIRNPRIYNRALTADEIKELYLNPTGNVVDNSVNASTPVPNSNAVRSSGGQLKAADPVESNDLVTKTYYEDNLSSVIVDAKKLIIKSSDNIFSKMKSYIAGQVVSRWGFTANNDVSGWNSICWSPELKLFVAVGGSGNRIVTSNNGINWIVRTAPASNIFTSVCWSSDLGLFCAVSLDGSGNRVMTSTDGITWTTRTSATDNTWQSICWSPELGLFCAVAHTGSGNLVMTSPNGIDWTTRVTNNNQWYSVCWSPELGLFCAVAQSGSGNRVMTSPNGIDWTTRASAANLAWNSICWSPSLRLFVAVAGDGDSRVMTSPNGIDWVLRATPSNGTHSINIWRSVCWSPELGVFVATSLWNMGATVRIMYSKNGILWYALFIAPPRSWRSVCWSPELGIFCTVSDDTSVGNIMITYEYTKYI